MKEGKNEANVSEEKEDGGLVECIDDCFLYCVSLESIFLPYFS